MHVIWFLFSPERVEVFMNSYGALPVGFQGKAPAGFVKMTPPSLLDRWDAGGDGP